MAKCCICNSLIERDDAPVFAMGVGGQPRLLCDECAHLLDVATLGREFDKIEAAMDKIGKLMADNDPDRVTFNAANELMAHASARAKAIKEGNYDFSLDEGEENTEGEFEDIPEELLETEEDKEQEKIEEEKAKKFDKVYTVILIIACVVLALILAYRGLVYILRQTNILQDIIDALADLLATQGINLYDYVDFSIIHKLF